MQTCKNMSVNNQTLPIALELDAIATLCQEHHILKLALFGSVLRDDFRPDSDVDVLVEFAPGRTPGFGFIDVQDKLSEIFGRKVDLNTPQCLSKYFRQEVVSEARVVYAQS